MPNGQCIQHLALPDVGDCTIFDPSTEFILSLSKCSGQVIRRLANFVQPERSVARRSQSYTSRNRCNRAILLFGALLMGGPSPPSADQDDLPAIGRRLFKQTFSINTQIEKMSQ